MLRINSKTLCPLIYLSSPKYDNLTINIGIEKSLTPVFDEIQIPLHKSALHVVFIVREKGKNQILRLHMTVKPYSIMPNKREVQIGTG